MERRRGLALLLVCTLIGNAFAVPIDVKRSKRAVGDNELDSVVVTSNSLVRDTQRNEDPTPSPELITEIFGKPPAPSSPTTAKSVTFSPAHFDDDDDDDDDHMEPMNTSSNGGSNVFSLLKLAGALFPGSSGSTSSSSGHSDQPASPFYTLKMDLLRAILQFGTSILGIASSSSSSASTT